MAAEAFERVQGGKCARFGWVIHAYVIMRNHFHLAVETPEPNLSAGMKFLQGTWATSLFRCALSELHRQPPDGSFADSSLRLNLFMYETGDGEHIDAAQ